MPRLFFILLTLLFLARAHASASDEHVTKTVAGREAAAAFQEQQGHVHAAAAVNDREVQNVQEPCSSPGSLPMQVQLQGSGFHRTLRYSFRRSEVASVAQCPHIAKVVLVQRLPVELFLDPFQLQDTFRASGVHTFKVFGPLDLEQPAPACRAVTLALTMNASAWGQLGQEPRPKGPDKECGSAGRNNVKQADEGATAEAEDAAGSCREERDQAGASDSGSGSSDRNDGANSDPGYVGGLAEEGAGADSTEVLELPVHARYAAPIQSTGAFWVLSGTVSIPIPMPLLAVHCQASREGAEATHHQAPTLLHTTLRHDAAQTSQSSGLTGQACNSSGSGAVAAVWLMPAGSLAHGAVAVWGTLLASVLASLCIGAAATGWLGGSYK